MANTIIFGATSAIAAECAKLLVSEGDSVYLVGRNMEKLERLRKDLVVRANDRQKIEAANADLDDQARHQELFDQAVASFGSLDRILIAHGTLPDQKQCESSVERTMQALNTNALSAVSLLTIAANYLESRGSGSLVAISSVAGDRGRQSNYVYGAAKGMVTLFMQGLRNRLAKQGVQVLTVKPGFVDTPMTQGITKKGALWAQPDAIAKGIISAIHRGRNEVYLLWFWRWIMLIIKCIPENIFKKLSL